MTETSHKRTAHGAGRRISRLVVAVGVTIGMVAVPVTGIANAQTSAPAEFKAMRTAPDLSSITASWRPVDDVDHYTVTLFDGKKDDVKVVDTTETSYEFQNLEPCQNYRVRVASVDAAGSATSTPVAWVDRLAPGGVRAVEVTRSPDGTASVTWQPPRNLGHGPLTGYEVRVKKLSTGEFITERFSEDTQETLTGLDPNREYAVKVTAKNEFGGCITSTIMLRESKPSRPTELRATRDPADPKKVTLNWNRPAWAGYGVITAYQVGYRRPGWKHPKWEDVVNDAFTMELDPDVRWSFHVRAFNGPARSKLSKELWFEKVSHVKNIDDPGVTIAEDNGVVTVNFNGSVESRNKYSRMNVAIAPALGGSGFADTHAVTNEAGQVVFTAVPCGVYRIVVTGQGSANTKEFKRLTVNRCETGTVADSYWKLLFGKADFISQTVNMRYGRDARVISTLDRTSPDMVMSTNATLRQGDGYVVWSRASVATGASVSGYALQVHPDYERINPGFGKAIHLRVWQNGQECGSRLARVRWPEGVDVNAEHRVMVVNHGNSYEASINGEIVVQIPDLASAVAENGCGFEAPTGSQVGFRTWSPEGKLVLRNTSIS